MKVIKSISEMQQWSGEQRSKGLHIGFVPTMGLLHGGHLSLIRIANEQTDLVVVSIFVNPTQFAPGEDFEQYPRDFYRDLALCEKEGVSVIFFPSSDEMYSKNHRTFIITEQISQVLCGQSRPNHFKGVTTIVCKLFNIVKPHNTFFGQKDAQQAIILKRMVEDLNMEAEIIIVPIVREPDGLAMSSRNKYLNDKERQEATILYHSLKMAEKEFDNHKSVGIMPNGTACAEIMSKIKIEMKNLIEENSGGKIDYIEIVDGDTLAEPTDQSKKILIALAVYFNQTRLIDNVIINLGKF